MTSTGREDIPSDVSRLIENHVRSVGHLESLLFLFQNLHRSWSALELSRELRTNEAYATHQLEELSPLIERVGSEFRYSSEPERDATVQRLCDLYRERRHAVINDIYSATRAPASLRSFADAFRIKKD